MADFKTGDLVLNTKTNKAGYIAPRAGHIGLINKSQELVKFLDGKKVIYKKYLQKIKIAK
jgi:hypothetical protein